MKDLILRFITLLHIFFILFVIITPFTKSNYFMLLHIILVPFMMLHWIFNNNTCVLTIIERYIRKKVYGDEDMKENCFTCKLIEPVYDFNKNYKSFSQIIYLITIGLWILSAGKLYCKYKSGEITNYQDLFNL